MNYEAILRLREVIERKRLRGEDVRNLEMEEQDLLDFFDDVMRKKSDSHLKNSEYQA